MKYKTIGEVKRNSLKLDNLIAKDAQIEVLAEGFDWSEGPIWVSELNALLFSDIPPNNIHIWREGDTEAALFIHPSGYTGNVERTGEPGSNGLILDAAGKLILCQHGDRQLAQLTNSFENPSPPVYQTIADKHNGKRFNSPNDVVQKSNGDFYFTDPPYGLEKNMDDPLKEIPYQGVYRVNSQGEVTLLTEEMSRPNGLAFSPDESKLYVANSDPENPVWMVFDLDAEGLLQNGKVFFDVTGFEGKGLPDGMKVDPQGNIYATGPGGVLVFDSDANHLGTIWTTEATANCAFGGPSSDYLYMTADMYLTRIKLVNPGL